MARVRAAFRVTRPDHVLLILLVYVVGLVAGVHRGSGAVPAPGDALLVGLVFALLAASVHAVNEYADQETDALTLRTRFSGGSGALADHRLPAVFALRIAGSAGVATVAMIVIGRATGHLPSTIAALLALCLVAGWAYSVGPWPFSRHGWGEVVNALLGGLLLPAAGAMMAGAPLSAALLAFLPFGLLVFVNLLETQWADRVADRAVGKHTLASRLSPRDLRRLGAAAAVAAYVAALLFLPQRVALAGLLAAPISAYGVGRLGRGAPGPSVIAMVAFLVLQGAAWLA